MVRQVIVNALFAFALTSLSAEVVQKSATGNSVPYREVCKAAAFDDAVFRGFRSNEHYFNAVECGQCGELAHYIREHATPRTFSLLSQCNRLDLYGNPVRHNMQGLGVFSGTTLRYILYADLISRSFNLPANYKVVEIGAGFGGQAYILSQLLPFSKYYIYDLPEPEMLISKMMATLSVQNVKCLDALADLPEESVDLFISNYALSECDRNTQLDYFNRVLVKAKRGFMLYNDVNIFDHLSLSEFIELFRMHGINAQIQPEPVFTYDGNKLITWDQTN